MLLDEAVATFTCSLQQEVDAGDHLLVLLQVLGVQAESDRSPLVFHRSGFQHLHREDLDPSRLHGRLNGEAVDGGQHADGGFAADLAAPNPKEADDRDAA